MADLQKERGMAEVAVLLTADDVTERLGVPRSWVYRAAREGDLPSVRCGRYRRFDEADVAGWIERRKEAPVAVAARG